MANTGIPRNRMTIILAALLAVLIIASAGWQFLNADKDAASPNGTTQVEQSASAGVSDAQIIPNHGKVIKAYMELKDGTVEIALWPDLAPKHVAQVTTLIKEGFYDNVVFHRVIDGFMAQTGDPTGTGMGGSELADIPAEFSDARYIRGTLGMARAQDPNSANSQFFITFGDTPFLEGDYTVFGQVISGMEYVDAIKKGDPQSGLMSDPDKIISFRLAE